MSNHSTEALAHLSDTSVPVCRLSTSSKEAAEVPLEIQGWDRLDPALCQVGQDCSQSLKVNSSHSSLGRRQQSFDFSSHLCLTRHI